MAHDGVSVFVEHGNLIVMQRSFWIGLMALASVIGSQSRPLAQDKPAEKGAAVAPTSGPRAEFLNELKGESEKFIRLAEAIPADKYTWRPGPDVRSVAEVLLHDEIRKWRRKTAIEKTLRNRPDLIDAAELSEEDRKLLAEIQR